MSYIAGVKVDRVDSSPMFSLGTEYTDQNGNTYQYVNLTNTTATVAGASGDVVAYGLAGAASNVVVTDNSDAATKPIGAGVLQATVVGTAGTAEYVWVLKKGKFTANQALAGTPADGDGLFLSTTDKTLTLSTAADDPVCAFADDASANLCVAAFN